MFHAPLCLVIAVGIPALGQTAHTRAPAAPTVKAQNYSGPFGFYAGETPAQVAAAVGKEAIKRRTEDAESISIVLTTAPKPHVDFHVYTLTFSRTKGLVRVTAKGFHEINDADGAKLRSDFEGLSKAISNLYGNPSNNFDFLKSGSAWSEPLEFMMAIAKEDRTLSAYWVDLPATLSDVRTIALEVEGDDRNSGLINFTYELTGYAELVAQHRARQDSTL